MTVPTQGETPKAGGAMSERMQALLSRAAEEQLSEQRQVSAVLGELRGLVTGLAEQLEATASSVRLSALADDLAARSDEMRTVSTGLADRVDALSRRVDEQGRSTEELVRGTGEGSQAVALRVASLAEDFTGNAEVLSRLAEAVSALTGVPEALVDLQGEVSVVRDRLTAMAEVRSVLGELAERTGRLEKALHDTGMTLTALAAREDLSGPVGELGPAMALHRERLDQLAARPAVDPEELERTLSRLQERLDQVAAPVLHRMAELGLQVDGLVQRVDGLGTQVATVSEATRALPSVSSGVEAMAGRLHELAALRTDLGEVRAAVTGWKEDSPLPSLVLGMATLREDVEDLAVRSGELVVPSADEVAGAVAQQLTDRLATVLAPRVAELVLQRVAGTLVEQVSGSVVANVQQGLDDRVRNANAESERRMATHVDEAVLALAEALLRRRRNGPRTRAGDVPQVEAPELDEPVRVQQAPAGPSDRLPPDAVQQGHSPPLDPAPEQAGAASDVDAPEATDALPGRARNPGPGDGADTRSATPGVRAEQSAVDVRADPARSAVATAHAGPAGQLFDDEHDAALRRRPWWRSGG